MSLKRPRSQVPAPSSYSGSASSASASASEGDGDNNKQELEQQQQQQKHSVKSIKPIASSKPMDETPGPKPKKASAADFDTTAVALKPTTEKGKTRLEVPKEKREKKLEVFPEEEKDILTDGPTGKKKKKRVNEFEKKWALQCIAEKQLMLKREDLEKELVGALIEALKMDLSNSLENKLQLH